MACALLTGNLRQAATFKLLNRIPVVVDFVANDVCIMVVFGRAMDTDTLQAAVTAATHTQGATLFMTRVDTGTHVHISAPTTTVAGKALRVMLMGCVPASDTAARVNTMKHVLQVITAMKAHTPQREAEHLCTMASTALERSDAILNVDVVMRASGGRGTRCVMTTRNNVPKGTIIGVEAVKLAVSARATEVTGSPMTHVEARVLAEAYITHNDLDTPMRVLSAAARSGPAQFSAEEALFATMRGGDVFSSAAALAAEGKLILPLLRHDAESDVYAKQLLNVKADMELLYLKCLNGSTLPVEPSTLKEDADTLSGCLEVHAPTDTVATCVSTLTYFCEKPDQHNLHDVKDMRAVDTDWNASAQVIVCGSGRSLQGVVALVATRDIAAGTAIRLAPSADTAARDFATWMLVNKPVVLRPALGAWLANVFNADIQAKHTLCNMNLLAQRHGGMPADRIENLKASAMRLVKKTATTKAHMPDVITLFRAQQLIRIPFVCMVTDGLTTSSVRHFSDIVSPQFNACMWTMLTQNSADAVTITKVMLMVLTVLNGTHDDQAHIMAQILESMKGGITSSPRTWAVFLTCMRGRMFSLAMHLVSPRQRVHVTLPPEIDVGAMSTACAAIEDVQVVHEEGAVKLSMTTAFVVLLCAWNVMPVEVQLAFVDGEVANVAVLDQIQMDTRGKWAPCTVPSFSDMLESDSVSAGDSVPAGATDAMASLSTCVKCALGMLIMMVAADNVSTTWATLRNFQRSITRAAMPSYLAMRRLVDVPFVDSEIVRMVTQRKLRVFERK